MAGDPAGPFPRQPFLPIYRRFVLPVPLLGSCDLAPLLGGVSQVAGDVKLQEDGVVHDPVDGWGSGHEVGDDTLPPREDQVRRNAQERRLIGALRNGGDSSGLIGGVVGEQVQNLPSTIYWNSLRSFGILRHDGTPTQIAGLRPASRPLDDATEYVEHSDAVWDPSMPGPPDDFFALASCDFALTRGEATWLAERIRLAAPDTLIEFLVEKGSRRPDLAQFAWDDDEVKTAAGQVRDAVNEARRFAIEMHGAALLYNLLLAERAEELGLSQHEGRRDYFSDLLDRWRDEVEASDLGSWNLEGLWGLISARGRPPSPLTLRFVTDWVSLVRGPSGLDIAGDQTARNLIREREIHQKRGQARLTNDRLMRQWGGASGSGRLNFRWPVVARLLNDIADGRS